MDINHTKQEPGSVRYVKSEPALLVKEEILEDGSQAGNEQQCVQGTTTPAGTYKENDGCSTSLSDLLNVKHEMGDIDIGPTVFQHMDIHNTVNKMDVNHTKQEPGSVRYVKSEPALLVKEEILEDGSQASRKQSSQKMTEDDYDEAHLKQQVNFQQHGYGDITIHKPHLLSARNKVKQRNNKKNSMMTTRVVASKIRDEKSKTKQKPNVGDKGYSSKAVKFAQSHYKCDTCDARFVRKGNFINHMSVHKYEKPYQCGTCDARFKQRGTLTSHMRIHTGEKPYRCVRSPTCDKKFNHRSGLAAHMRVHTGEKPYWCDTCDKRYAQNCSLVEHMRVHTRQKPYQCDTCDKRFALNRTLVRHVRTVHTSDKPYQCHTCDKRFALNSTLVRHVKVHTGEKPYQCDTCYKRFNYRSGLTVHMRVHTGEKP